MRIMTILGSPRPNGNTAQVLEWVEQQLRADGHEVDKVHIVDYTVGGCRECYACKQGGIDLCAFQDDANQLLERMLAADVVVFAAPLFCWGFPAQLKGLVDRMFCFAGSSDENSDYTSKAKDKRFGLLVTSAGPKENNADLLVRVFDNLVEYLKAKSAGHLVVPLCTTPEAIGEDVKTQAGEFANQLV